LTVAATVLGVFDPENERIPKRQQIFTDRYGTAPQKT